MSTPDDVIVIGTGAGGGTLAMHLAQAGKNILIRVSDHLLEERLR